MPTGDSNYKGNVAELKIAAEAARLRIGVYSPMIEHGRTDLVFEAGGTLLRVQCKSASKIGDAVVVRLVTNRRGPDGYIRRTYGRDEIDGVAAYCPDLDQCYYLPIDRIEGMTAFRMRLAPPRNSQRAALNFAADYPLGAVAQLGERPAGSREVRGSIPLSSISTDPSTIPCGEYRDRLGWYMERAAAGESFLITRHGKPFARLAPPADPLPLADAA